MASALSNKCDSVVTMGGLQSNHCRATAVVSRQLGLQPHLLLRSKDMVLVLLWHIKFCTLHVHGREYSCNTVLWLTKTIPDFLGYTT